MKPIVILHEGNDKSSLDNKLVKNLIEHLKLDEKDADKEFKKIKFYGMGVKSNFFNANFVVYRELIQRIADYEISNIFFILDADNCNKNQGGLIKTQEKLQAMIKSLGWEEISSFYITHDPQTEHKEGFIESLLLSTIPQDKKECIDKFLECFGFIAKDGDKSTYERIYKSIAHPLPPYNFDHPHFDELKQKLRSLFITDL